MKKYISLILVFGLIIIFASSCMNLGEKYQVVLKDKEGNVYLINGKIDGKDLKIEDGKMYIYLSSPQDKINITLDTTVFKNNYTVAVDEKSKVINVTLERSGNTAADVLVVNGEKRVIFSHFSPYKGVDLRFEYDPNKDVRANWEAMPGKFVIKKKNLVSIMIDPNSNAKFDDWFSIPAANAWKKVKKIYVLVVDDNGNPKTLELK